jgi:uncharacterized membrane protein (DUF106 family)
MSDFAWGLLFGTIITGGILLFLFFQWRKKVFTDKQLQTQLDAKIKEVKKTRKELEQLYKKLKEAQDENSPTTLDDIVNGINAVSTDPGKLDI